MSTYSLVARTPHRLASLTRTSNLISRSAAGKRFIGPDTWELEMKTRQLTSERIADGALKHPRIKPILFGERPGAEPYNASEIVAIADSRFLFCDNNISDALFELRLDSDGAMAGPLIERPIEGIEPGTVDDLEGLALVQSDGNEAQPGGKTLIFANASFSLKRRKKPRRKRSKRGKECPPRNCLLRISCRDDDRCVAEILPDLREWIVESWPLLGKFPRYVPDDGGLNIEAMGWSPKDQALLLGLRSPVIGGNPIILPIRLKKLDGPWDLSNIEMLPAVSLAIKASPEEQGIRSIEFDASRGVLLVIVGNSTSASNAPFELYSWDGNSQGGVRHFNQLRFKRRMRVEGVTHGWIGGRGAIVFVDDAGGYQVVWDDDPRLL